MRDSSTLFSSTNLTADDLSASTGDLVRGLAVEPSFEASPLGILRLDDRVLRRLRNRLIESRRDFVNDFRR